MRFTYRQVKQYVEQGHSIYHNKKTDNVYVFHPTDRKRVLNINRHWDKLQRECRIEIFEEQVNMVVYKCLPNETSVGE
jgi:aspartate carbamoyltransferase catalytic subunit